MLRRCLVIVLALMPLLWIGSASADVLFKFDVTHGAAELDEGTVVTMNASNQVIAADGTDRDVEIVGVIIGKEDDGGTMKYLVATSGIIEISGASFPVGARLTCNASGQIVVADDDEDVLVGIAMSATRVQLQIGDMQARYSYIDPSGASNYTSTNLQAAIDELDAAIDGITATDDWVNETGDNMTGNLTFNTSNVVITASTGNIWTIGDVYMANNQQFYMKNNDGTDQAWITPRNGNNDIIITMGTGSAGGNNLYIQDASFNNVAQFSAGSNALRLYGNLVMQDKSVWDADYVEANYIQDGEDNTVEVLDNLTVQGNAGVTAGNDLYVGSIGLNDVGTGPTSSGASLVGTYDEFTFSDGTNVQDVLDDLDAAITAAGAPQNLFENK